MTKEELLQQPEDAYMNAQQQEFFHELLLKQRVVVQERIEEEFDGLRKYEIGE
ncbi:hypothetical protein MBH78_21475 [Oceanimonas sp. NS1]|nr:hypothetical protein [Oceanimonas sp. NS1]